MTDRLEQLAEWRLPPSILALARGVMPHPAFKAICEPIRFKERHETWGLELDKVQNIGPSGQYPAIALWEHDIGDGHAFEVIYCEWNENGIEFWYVMYADDMGEPQPKRLAKSEQGLYFWLFFFLIGSEFWVHGERAYGTLVAAANSVGFRYLMEVFKLEEEIGTEDNREDLLQKRALELRD